MTGEEWILLFRITANEKPKLQIFAFRGRLNWESHIYMYDTLEQGFKGRKGNIIAPYNQISAIRFSIAVKCAHQKIWDLQDAPDRLSPIVRHFSDVEYRFSISVLRNVEPMTITTDFLKEVRLDSKARGNLKSLKICGWDEENREFLDFPGVVQLFHGLPYDFTVWHDDVLNNETFYKLKIDGGLAVIIKTITICHINFVNDENRQSIFDILVPQMFGRLPLDCSAVYDDFMAEEDEAVALEKLHAKFWDGFLSWSMEKQARGGDDDSEESSEEEVISDDDNFVIGY